MGVIISGCNVKNSNKGNYVDPIPVIAGKAVRTNAVKEISLSGNIEGFKTVRIGFLVAGRINFIAANEGEFLSKDQLVASLDPASYEIAKELADIQVSQVEDEYNRLKIMYDNKSLSESDFAKISYGLRQAIAQQKLHAKNLSDTRISSPVSGILLKKLCETGEIIGPGLPLFVISDIRKVKVSSFIPENELRNIKIGQEATISVSPVGETLEGKIIEIGSAADIASHSFSVKIELDNPGLLIRPGMIAGITIKTGSATDMLTVPVNSLQNDFNNMNFLYVVDTIKNRAFKRYVSPGRLYENRIEITSGLNENEIVVTEGQQKLIDGSPVSFTK
jgi:RND family efflux transporter MFP subunit